MRLVIALFLLVSSHSIFAQNIGPLFFDEADALFGKFVADGRIDYATLQGNKSLNNLVETIGAAELDGLDDKTKQAFYINAYNILVIKQVLDDYPLSSVETVNGFFDGKKNLVAGESLTLNSLEKDKLLSAYDDPRFHFVLVCGAVSCPPITNFAYRPNQLERQLNQQTTKALNDDTFIQVNNAEGKVGLSQIFNWYESDFGGNKTAVLNFINEYRNTAIPSSHQVNYYTYDWSLNALVNTPPKTVIEPNTGAGNNASRYVVSSAIPKGSTETKIFNNLYTQKIGNNRATYFTTSVSFLYGIHNRFNLGFDLRYRRVSEGDVNASPFSVLGNPADARNRQGVTGFGPKIRWAPTAALPNFSIQSTLHFPIGTNLQGNDMEPFIEWDGALWNTQFFNDLSIGDNFSLFTEVDFLIEDIGKGDLNRISTPATVIFSFFPTPKATLYALGGYSPYWESEFSYFAQAGVGGKYQFTPNFEVELLYTGFTNTGLRDSNGQASTYNIGFRFSQ